MEKEIKNDAAVVGKDEKINSPVPGKDFSAKETENKKEAELNREATREANNEEELDKI